MSRCLSEQTLLWLYEREGTDAQRAHLATCATCAMRYQRLVHDLEVIRDVLWKVPPPQTDPHRSPLLSIRWLPVATASAVAVLVVWSGVWLQSPLKAPETVSTEDLVRFLEETVSPALFSTADTSAADIPAPAADAIYAQAALAGTWPCEYTDPFSTPECGDLSFPFFFEE